MPRDGAGLYSLPSGNPVVTNTVIASAWANTTMSDIAAQLNNVLTRDGLLGPTGPFKLQDGTGAAPGLAWNSEPGLGWYRPSASVIAMTAQGAVVNRIDASNATSVSSSLFPRASGQSVLYLRNAPISSANLNQLGIVQNQDGNAYILTAAAGTATRGNLTIDAPLTSMTGALGVADVITTRLTSTVGGKQASLQNTTSVFLAPGVESTFTMSGMLLVNDIDFGGIALFVMGGGYVSLMGDPNTFSTVLGTAGKMNCASFTGPGGPFYTFKNETASGRSVSMLFFKTRDAV